jgi:hypothetical protein
MNYKIPNELVVYNEKKDKDGENLQWSKVLDMVCLDDIHMKNDQV